MLQNKEEIDKHLNKVNIGSIKIMSESSRFVCCFKVEELTYLNTMHEKDMEEIKLESKMKENKVIIMSNETTN